jgi:hypothetical protein
MTDSVRHLHGIKEQMEKYHAEIERLVYAAEIACANSDARGCIVKGCPFVIASPTYCALSQIRGLIGDHVEQHDPGELSERNEWQAAALEDAAKVEERE